MRGVWVWRLVLLGGALALGCANASVVPAPSHAAAPRSPALARAAQVEVLLASGHAFARQRRGPEAEAQLRQAIKLSWGFGEPWARYRAEGLTALAHCLVKE